MPICGQDVWQVCVPPVDQAVKIRRAGTIQSINVWKEVEGEMGTKITCWQVKILREKKLHVPEWGWVHLLNGKWYLRDGDDCAPPINKQRD